MRFIPYADTATIPNIVVDGPKNTATVLALSHWTGSGTPPALKADTSTEIVFNYLDRPSVHVRAEGASNNHFDEDGLLGIFALLDPAAGARHRALLIDASRAGDFGVYQERDAARIAFVLKAWIDRAVSPLPADIFTLPRSQQAVALYRAALQLLPQLLASREPFRPLWQGEDDRLTETEGLIDSGVVTLEEQPDLDLVIVRQPAATPRYHPFAVHSRTRRSRVVVIHGPRIELHYRYEGWVQLATYRPALRVDLTGVVDALNAGQCEGGRWVFDAVDHIEPRFYFDGDGEPTASVDEVLASLQHQLRTGSAALDPYRE